MIATVKGFNYGHLAEALKELGFQEIVSDEGRTFRHPSGARLPLPALNDSESLRAYHLVVTRATVNDYGIMDARDFDLLIARLAQSPVPTGVM